LKIELSNEANKLVVQRGVECRQYKKEHSGARYIDFADQWNAQLADKVRFGDVARRAEELLKNTQPGGANAPRNGSGITIDQRAIQLLRSNPSLADQFDQKYGAGSASRYIGGQ
jgi:hypothetical protein